MEIRTHIKLSDLTRQVEDVIKGAFNSTYWIIAEIEGHKFYPNDDRHYFDFIEKSDVATEQIAKVSGVSWRDGSRTIKAFEKETGQLFGNGLQVLVNVRVEFKGTYGFKLVLLDIDANYTLGNLERQRRETLLRLVNENPDAIRKVGDEYKTRNKVLGLNKVLQSIAVIGSQNSEGFTDFVHTLHSNNFKYTFAINVYHSSVQGAGVENELVGRLIDIFNSKIPYDCVVIVRGGGAKTDFQVFDTYKLTRAAARFTIPIITGLGHHKDVSITDLMVHTSTKTPTKAAEFIVSHNREFEESVLQSQKNITIKAQQVLSSNLQMINKCNVVVVNKSRTMLATFNSQLNLANQSVINKTKTILYNRKTNLVSLLNQLQSKPRIITANKQSELNNVILNIKSYSNKYLVNQKGYLGHYESLVRIMSPKNILKKGFAIVSRKNKILKSGEDLAIGEEISISMQDYTLSTKLITKIKKDGTESEL